MKPELVIWGASGHARVVADIVRLQGRYTLVGFLDDVHPERQGMPFCDATILGGQEQLEGLLREGVRTILFGFGNVEARLRLSDLVKGMGFQLATAIHPAAVVASDVKIGSGTVIKAGAVIDPGVTLGENVIVGASVTIAHESSVATGVRISAGAQLGGSSHVEKGAWVGIGAIIKDRVKVGAFSLVGAGSVVVRNIPDGVVARGVPARVVRVLTPADV